MSETSTQITMRLIRNEIIEECAKVADMRAKVWEEAVKADVHSNCAMSLWEECEDIAQHIRKLAQPTQQVETK